MSITFSRAQHRDTALEKAGLLPVALDQVQMPSSPVGPTDGKQVREAPNDLDRRLRGPRSPRGICPTSAQTQWRATPRSYTETGKRRFRNAPWDGSSGGSAARLATRPVRLRGRNSPRKENTALGMVVVRRRGGRRSRDGRRSSGAGSRRDRFIQSLRAVCGCSS